MTKYRQQLHLSAATTGALRAYQARESRRFRTLSAAADHLLSRALTAELDEGTEGLLAPLIAEVVEDAATRAVDERVGKLLAAQSDRLAGLLVKSGKDAHRGAVVAEAVLRLVADDPAQAERVVTEARMAAGPAYSKHGLAGEVNGR